MYFVIASIYLYMFVEQMIVWHQHCRLQGRGLNVRGSRYYVTLPFGVMCVETLVLP